MATIMKKFRHFEETSSSWDKYRFYYIPVWMNLTPKLRSDMEGKIFEKLFLGAHHFPPHFNSPKYLSKLFSVSLSIATASKVSLNILIL